jgi:hypothetical protein
MSNKANTKRNGNGTSGAVDAGSGEVVTAVVGHGDEPISANNPAFAGNPDDGAALSGNSDAPVTSSVKPAGATTTLKSNPLDVEMNVGEFTNARFALFNHTPEDADDGKTHPIMRGVLEAKGYKLEIGAFVEKSEGGTNYLSLSIGSSDTEKVYGRFFKETKVGSEGHYYGYIEKSQLTGADAEGKKQYTTLWSLAIDAKRMESAQGTKYIGGKVYAKAGKKSAAAATEVNF